MLSFKVLATNVKRTVKMLYLGLKYWNRLDVDMSCNIGINSTFEGANKIYPNTIFNGTMGYGSYIGPNCEICGQIGRYTSIAPYVRVNVGKHPYKTPYVTTCPMFFSTRRQNGYTFAKNNLFKESGEIPQIGNDCWIGENVFICSDVIIGDGAVVLAGSVVTKNIPPYAIVGGIPAVIIKYRYDVDTISFLLKSKWWEKDVDWLSTNWELLCDIQKFKSCILDA